MHVKAAAVALAIAALSSCTLQEGTPQPDADGGSGRSIIVTAPAPDALVGSPIRVEGMAVGPWYFEASFPLSVVAGGAVVGTGFAEAQGEWMTESFVPFRGEVQFTTTAATGALVLHRANPSGLPERDEEVRVPLRFR